MTGARVATATVLLVVSMLMSMIATSTVAVSRLGASQGRTPSGEITVAAASSLTDAFRAIVEDFERAHDDVSVVLNLGASSTLATQLEQGAPADVFAAADPVSMARLEDADGVATRPRRFAENRLTIAVERGNPLRIASLADTVGDDVRLVLCAREVPCGRYAHAAYVNADVELPEVPTGLNAKDTLAKVALGEADAAVVYATDVASARSDVVGIRIPRTENVVARYPIAVTDGSENPRAAKAFVRFVLSEQGRARLREQGFRVPGRGASR